MTQALAFVFPGQGSQSVGMGRGVHRASANARRTFEEADDVLGYRLSAVCFDGPAERLDDTATAQPAILTTSVAILEALAERAAALGRRISEGKEPRGVAALPQELRPAYVAGHSLGEFTALVAAGVLTFADALRLVAERGDRLPVLLLPRKVGAFEEFAPRVGRRRSEEAFQPAQRRRPRGIDSFQA